MNRPDRARTGIAGTAAAMIAGLVLSGCGTTPSSSAPTAPLTTVPSGSISASTTTDQSVGMPKSSLNLKAVALGSKVYSTSIRAVGSEFVCSPLAGSLPVKIPPWVNTAASTWNMTTKVAVAGDVAWRSTFRTSHSGSNLVLRGNDLPPRSGTFPVDPADPAYADNPDLLPVTANDFRLSIPNNPAQNPVPSCVTGDAPVGVMSNGVILVGPLDANGNDAAAVETQDTCHGSPGNTGYYHYVSLSPCLLSPAALTTTTQVGWALDGFGIYVEYGADGNLLTNQDLDVCHGRTSVVPWHGKMVNIYHYDLTLEYPYAVSCFAGTPSLLRGS